jgi:hypothetical protein
MHRLALLALASLLSLAAACGGDDHDDVSPAEDACEHMVDGPSVALTAVDGATADPPDMDESHHRYDVTLVALAADNGGYLDLVSDEAGDIHLFMTPTMPIKLWDGQGNPVAPESSQATVPECAEVAVGYTYDLGVGTYTVELGPTSETMVQIVPVHGGGENAH